MPPRSGKRPSTYVIAGPNGAGKTTFATKFLPEFLRCREFLNADLIAAGLSPFAPETQNVRAGRLLLERIRELTSARHDFGFETTLSGRTYRRILERMRIDGYTVNLVFLWLPSVDLAVSRVANRVRQGGHGIPEMDIRRRFQAGLRNLRELYMPLCDNCWIYDASVIPPIEIAASEYGQLHVSRSDLFDRFTKMTKGER